MFNSAITPVAIRAIDPQTKQKSYVFSPSIASVTGDCDDGIMLKGSNGQVLGIIKEGVKSFADCEDVAKVIVNSADKEANSKWIKENRLNVIG